jgi:polysaccharide pyruvyl transferase WcaK-like protein
VHAALGALSMRVPVCVIAHPSDRRAYSLLRPLDQDKLIFDVRDISSEKLFYHLKEIILNSDKIKDELNRLVPYVQRSALVNGILLKNLLRWHYERK